MLSTPLKHMAWIVLTLGACGADKPSNDPTAADTGVETAATQTTDGGTSGTGGTTGGESDFAARCRAFAVGPAGSALALEQCACRVKNGSEPDIETCIANMTLDDGGTDGMCVCDYYEDHPDEQFYLECIFEADAVGAACIAAAECDEDQIGACFEPGGGGYIDCPPPSEATMKGLPAACPSS